MTLNVLLKHLKIQYSFKENFYMKIAISQQGKEGSKNITVSTSMVMPFIFVRKKSEVINPISFLKVAVEHDFSKFIKSREMS